MIKLSSAPLDIDASYRLDNIRSAKNQQFLRELASGRTDFSGMDMSGFHLMELNLDNCIFRGANMNNVDMYKVSLDGADFSNANLSKATFEYVKGKAVEMIEATLKGAAFRHCTFEGCVFADADLSHAQIGHSVVRGCNFQRANLSDFYAGNVVFDGVSFGDVRAVAPARLNHSKFYGVSWSGAKTNLQCEHSEFRDIDFSGAELYKSPFFSCAFHGPIEFDRCKGFYKLVNCTVKDVNLIPLEDLPEELEEGDSCYGKDHYCHTWNHAAWNKIIKWEKREFEREWDEVAWCYKSDLYLVLTVDLERYRKGVEVFHPILRKYLREKVTALMKTLPELQTNEARVMFAEIVAADDAWMEKENEEKKSKQVNSPRALPSPSLGFKDSALVSESVASWSVNSSRTGSFEESRPSNKSDSSTSGEGMEQTNLPLFA